MRAVIPESRAIVRDNHTDLREVAGVVSWLWRKVVQHYVERRAAAELARMSDAQLRDIGLRRDEILDAVHGRIARHRKYL